MGCGAQPFAMYYLGVSLVAAAVATSGSEINRGGGRATVDGGDHVRVVFAATMLLTSLVRSAIWF